MIPFRAVISLFIASMTAMSAYSSTWSVLMVSMLKRGGYEEIRNTLQQRNTGKGLESDFVDVVSGLKEAAPRLASEGLLLRYFEKPLAAALTENTFKSFASIVTDQKAPDEAKRLILKVILGWSGSIASNENEAKLQMMKDVLFTGGVSSDFKGDVLKGLGRFPGLPDEAAFLPYLVDANPILKSAAYRGLGQRIRANRAANRGAENRRIFEKVKVIAAENPDLFTTRALSQISEDYARDYLALNCAGDREKIQVVLRSDASLTHIGIISEALELFSGSGFDKPMATSIRYGVKSPGGILRKLLAGSDTQVELGLMMLRAFTEFVPEHEALIKSLINGPNQTLKSAALALSPYFSERNALAEKNVGR